ncbi:MAG: hypothetical protein ABW123_01790 [Cystobacter sp.]
MFTLRNTSPKAWNWPEWARQSKLVDLDEEALKAVAEMDADALVGLIIESQQPREAWRGGE